MAVTLLRAVVSYRSETWSCNVAKNTDSQCDDKVLRSGRGLRETRMEHKITVQYQQYNLRRIRVIKTTIPRAEYAASVGQKG